MIEFIKLLEIIGTIAFAVSGAFIACDAGLDMFGVVFVGCITAIGGGMIRDTFLGINPPMLFSNYVIFMIAVLTGTLVFIIAYINKNRFRLLKTKIEFVNNFFDAVGLAAFSLTGAEIGFTSGYSDNPLLIVIIGMITGVGGGIMRDILIDTTPYVFKKHIYALASIIGVFLYYILRKCYSNISIDSLISLAVIVTIRMLATKYRWSLPKVDVLVSHEEELVKISDDNMENFKMEEEEKLKQ